MNGNSFRPLLRDHEQGACAVGLGVAALVIVLYWWSLGPTRFVADGPLPAGRPSFQVNVNEAEWSELAMLPGIGRTLAQRIVDRRSVTGRFQALGDLLAVRGIGPRKLEAMRPFAILKD